MEGDGPVPGPVVAGVNEGDGTSSDDDDDDDAEYKPPKRISDAGVALRALSSSSSPYEAKIEKAKILLAIDIGSSSTRCSAWRLNDKEEDDEDERGEGTVEHDTNELVPLVEPYSGCGCCCCCRRSCSSCRDKTTAQKVPTAMACIMSSRSVKAIDPDTGRIASVKRLLDAVDEVVDEALRFLRMKSCCCESNIACGGKSRCFQVVGVGFSAFAMNLVGVDRTGTPLEDSTCTLSYACNTPEVAQQVADLKKELLLQGGLEQHLYRTTGSPLHNSYAIPQLRALYKNHPDLGANVYKWQTIPSLCLSRWLTKSSVEEEDMGPFHSSSPTAATIMSISYSEASWAGLLDVRTGRYSELALNLLPAECREALPDVRDYDGWHEGGRTVEGSGLPTTSPYYERWPELRSSRFMLGLGDGACATVGSKCTSPQRISVTVGTSAAARTCLELPISSNLDPLKKESTTLVNVPPGLFCYRFTRHHVLLGGALTDGGSAVEWATRLLNLDSSSQASDACWSEVEELVESQVLVTSEQKFPSFPGPKGGAAATARSLTFVPFLSGERSTGFRDSATGCLLGLTLATRPAHLLKSCLEGVTLRLGSIVSLLRPALVSKISPAYRVDLEENHEDGASEGEDGACLIVVSGKAMEARSLWRQMLADCTGLEVVCDDEASSESTSRGVATMLALALQGGANKQLKEKALPLEELKPHRVARPCAAVAPFWERLATEQERLLDALAPIYGTGHGRPALTS